MVFDVLGSLSSSARRELARNLFPGFYERGLSANVALRTLREMGLGYRRQDFLRDFAQGEGSYSQRVKVRFVPGGKVPSESILEGKYHGVSDKYSLVFRGEYYNVDTDKTESKYFFYHRNSLATRSEMEEDAFEWSSGRESDSTSGITSVRLVEGYINPLWQ